MALLRLLACALAFSACSKPGPDCSRFQFNRQTGTRVHTATCDDTSCGNGLNPPTAGPHCGQTLACRVWDSPQQRCKWLHNLEHGHAVLAYNCPDGCPDEVATLTELWSADSNLYERRRILLPDAQLPDRFAAVVWGWSWTGPELDVDAITCLLQHQDEEAPERGLSCPQ